MLVSHFFLLISDPEAPVPLLPSGFPRRFHGCLWVQTCIKQKVAGHAQSYNGARTILQRSQCCSRCHGSHADPATAANSRSDCLQVLESSAPLSPYSKEGEKWQMHHLEFGSFVCLGFFKWRLLNGQFNRRQGAWVLNYITKVVFIFCTSRRYRKVTGNVFTALPSSSSSVS